LLVETSIPLGVVFAARYNTIKLVEI